MWMAIVVVYLFGLGVLLLVSLWWFRREVHRARVARMLKGCRLARTVHRMTVRRSLYREGIRMHMVWEEPSPALRERVLRFLDENKAKQASTKPGPGAS